MGEERLGPEGPRRDGSSGRVVVLCRLITSLH